MRDHPEIVAQRIKGRLAQNIGTMITCSIGIAVNRQLAKMACKVGKKNDGRAYGNGLEIWRPEDMPTPLINFRSTIFRVSAGA